MNYILLPKDDKLQFFDEAAGTFVELPFTGDADYNPTGGGALGAMDCCVSLPSGDGWLYGAARTVSNAPEQLEKWYYTGEIGFVSKDFSFVTPPIFDKVIPGPESGYDNVRHPLLFRAATTGAVSVKSAGRTAARASDTSRMVYCAFQGALFFLPMSWASTMPDFCLVAKDAGKLPPIFLAGISGQTVGLYFGHSRATFSVEETHETLGTILSLSSDPFAGNPTVSGLHTPSKFYYYCEGNFRLADLKSWYQTQAFRYTGMTFLGGNHLAVQKDGMWGISTKDLTGFSEPAEFCFTAAPHILKISGHRRLHYLLVKRFGLYGLLWIDSSNIITDKPGYYWALPCEYDDIDYTEALSGDGATDYIPIRKNGRWGLFGIDDFHGIVLPCDYASLTLSWDRVPGEEGSNRLCAVRRLGDEGVYNLTGKRWVIRLHPAEG